ncbi:hypothetical protein FACS1894187_18260 [Synergistales bacterium]|nr:hypothetical protein FACS1894187_18260 [Synergistales bacterium]
MALTTEETLELIKLNLEKTKRAYSTAVTLSETIHDYDAAANRAYYAMFYTEKALLYAKDISATSHKHVHTSLAENFVKTGDLLSSDIYF